MNSKPIPQPDCPNPIRVNDHVPMAHVVDVDRSIEFYSLLGFSCGSRFADDDGQSYYAALFSDKAELMFARASAPIVANEQAILFYMYAPDVLALREHLLSKGLPDAGRPPSQRKPGDSDKPIPLGPALFEITHPFYMSEGELRVHDPDQYVILIGQTDRQQGAQTSCATGRIAQVGITVSDVEIASRYYQDVIGLKLLFNAGPNLAFFTDGAIRIMLTTPQGAGRVGANSILYFSVSQIEEAYQAMVEKGSATERAPQLAAKMPDHELWIGFLRDPDGNLVGIMEEKR